MKRLTITAALAAALASLPAAAQFSYDGWLRGYSYACPYQYKYDEIRRALEVGDHRTRDTLIARDDCYLIRNAAKVDILVWKEEQGKALVRAYEGGRSVELWVGTHDIRRKE